MSESAASLTPPTKAPKAPKAPKDPNAVKEPKTPKAPKEAKFAKLYPKDAPISVLVEKNPKRAGSKSAERFEAYFKAKTVGEALAGGATYADLSWDVGHGHVKVG